MIVSAPSGGVEAGESWNAILRLPIATDPGAPPTPRHPELVFTHLASDVQRRFDAEPTPRRGVFRARVLLSTTASTHRLRPDALRPHAAAEMPSNVSATFASSFDRPGEIAATHAVATVEERERSTANAQTEG